MQSGRRLVRHVTGARLTRTPPFTDRGTAGRSLGTSRRPRLKRSSCSRRCRSTSARRSPCRCSTRSNRRRSPGSVVIGAALALLAVARGVRRGWTRPQLVGGGDLRRGDGADEHVLLPRHRSHRSRQGRGDRVPRPDRGGRGDDADVAQRGGARAHHRRRGDARRCGDRRQRARRRVRPRRVGDVGHLHRRRVTDRTDRPRARPRSRSGSRSAPSR